ncbi:MAG TPA: serine hydrolase domain-containing protein, partial [Vicinamibacterales bacterium]|nr:serine hydrolase domain-containing protein [Vicinamibacterales bacterium]
MTTNRRLFWLALIAIVPGVLLTGVGGLFVYMSVTARPIHPNARDVRSMATLAPASTWAASIARGQDLIRAHVADDNLPGASIAVAVGGDIVWAEGFGWADLDNRIPVTPSTRFRLGTASKMLASAAAGLLLEEGRLKLDAEIQTYVPSMPRKRWPVTLRQLMNHQGGIRPDEGDEEPLLAHCERPVDGIQRFAGGALLFEPGTRYRYSNYGWILVSAAIEAAGRLP